MSGLHLGLRNVSLPEVDKAYLRRAIDGSMQTISLKSDYIAAQIFPTTADENFLPIHGAIRGVPR